MKAEPMRSLGEQVAGLSGGGGSTLERVGSFLKGVFHGGGAAEPSEAAKPSSRGPPAWLDRAAVTCEILMLTLVMGWTEIDDPITLSVFCMCGLVLVNGTVFLACAENSVAAGVLAAIALDLGAAATLRKLRQSLRRIEEMDEIASRFDSAWATLCEATDERGPPVRKASKRSK